MAGRLNAMSPRSLLVALWFATAVSVASGSVLAWGPHGHEVVAEIAARELTPAARAEVERLLGDRASNAMRGVSSWADDARNEPAWRHTVPWHWVNFRRGDCSYAPSDNCRNGDCVVAAIERQTRVLANRKARRADRVNALKFVIHFVGDVHQPLHAGYADDRGGNDVQIRYGREGGNLHGYWDSNVIKQMRQTARAHAEQLLGDTSATGAVNASWYVRAPGDWAEESCHIVQEHGFYPERNVLESAYVARYAPVANNRLETAGRRLAALLNATLTNAPAP